MKGFEAFIGIVALVESCRAAQEMPKVMKFVKDYVEIQDSHFRRNLLAENDPKQRNFEYTLFVNDEISYTFELEPLKLYGDDFEAVFVDENGIETTNKADQYNLDCFFTGKVKDDLKSNVLLSLCNGKLFSRIIQQHEEHFVHTEKDNKGVQHAFFFNARSFHEPTNGVCGVDSASFHTFPPEKKEIRRNLRNSETNHRKLGATKYNLELVIVNSASRYALYEDDLVSDTFDLMAMVNTNYKNLGEEFGDSEFKFTIKKMVTFVRSDPAEWKKGFGEADDGATLLPTFGSWASYSSLGEYDLVHLLHGTKSIYDDNEILGLAYVGVACNFDSSARSGFSLTTNTMLTNSIVVSHEIGHNLGMSHADNTPKCKGNFIMTSYVDDIHTEWSSCSNADLNDFLNTLDIKCLQDGSKSDEKGPICGNGIVENKEECDCPLNDCSTVDPCCDGKTCKLLPSSSCSAVDPCCTKSCKIVEKDSKVCRPSLHKICDAAEVCDGISSKCPTDVQSINGLPCEDSKDIMDVFHQAGGCFEGNCVGRNQQCVDLAKQFPSVKDYKTAKSTNCKSLECLGPNNMYVTYTIDFKEGTPCCKTSGCNLQKNEAYCLKKNGLLECVTSEFSGTCSNGKFDAGLETDVDCGSSCGPCNVGENCVESSDCKDPSKCKDNVCTIPVKPPPKDTTEDELKNSKCASFYGRRKQKKCKRNGCIPQKVKVGKRFAYYCRLEGFELDDKVFCDEISKAGCRNDVYVKSFCSWKKAEINGKKKFACIDNV